MIQPAFDSTSFDSNVLTYFLEANSGAYDPTTDPDTALAAERLTAYRLFLYGPSLWIVPSILREAEAIRNAAKREEHLRWIYYSLREILPEWLNEDDVLERQNRYGQLHPSGNLDCRALAEAESAGLKRFITFDSKLIRRLAGHTDRIVIQSPTQCWTTLAIPQGASPRLLPHDIHPLAQAQWWRW
jgi:predicted nucleic acid-binding protein